MEYLAFGRPAAEGGDAVGRLVEEEVHCPRGQQPHEQREGPDQFGHVVARAGARRLERLEQLVGDLVRVRARVRVRVGARFRARARARVRDRDRVRVRVRI